MDKRKDSDDSLRNRFTAWLIVLLRRAKSRYLLEQKYSVRTYPIDLLPEELFCYEHNFDTFNKKDFLFEDEKLFYAYKNMSQNWKMVLIKLFIEDKTPSEISAEMNISREQVWKIRSLALKRLKEAIEDENE